LRPLWREMLITRAFYSYLSKFPVKRPPSKFPIGALRREMPITRAFYTYHLERPGKEPPPPGSPLRAPIELPSISKARPYLCLKRPEKGAPYLIPQWGPHGKSCPFLEPSYIQFTHSR
jgi:hypothetical protein